MRQQLKMFVHGALKERDSFWRENNLYTFKPYNVQNHYIMYLYINCKLLLLR